MAQQTNETWRTRREAAVPRAIGSAFPIYAARAENAEIWDVDGRRFIDFAGGIAVLNSGHRHPAIMKRVAQQSERFTHTCFQVLPYDGYIELAERLNEIAPTGGPRKTAFFSTGAEAIENALKIARYATGRPAYISFVGAFHGRTMMALALTGKIAAYKAGFGPFPADVFHAPFPNEARGVSIRHSLEALDRLFQADVDPQRVAAIVVEPVQGEGGFYVAPADFLRELRAVCDAHGVLLVADEIQTGFARTGRMFALEHAGVQADIVTMAKSLAGGFPLSAVTGRADLMDSIPPGGLGSTYAGHPLACAAALGVLDVIEEEDLCGRAIQLGQKLVDRLTGIRRRNVTSMIGDIRGLGSMIALEFVYDRDLAKPAPDLAKAVIAEAAANGLLLLSCGPAGNVIRFLYPLTIRDDTFDESLNILEQAIEMIEPISTSHRPEA
jgi:4-aminobutyrate aminotransferase/(S)-3-amino-2-methylpropionate transaminase